MCAKVKYILLIYLFINITQIIVSQNIKRCNCYMLGTFHNKQGQSICDKYTGVCSCLKNIDGINCDKCREGYYDILSGRGCKFCACNMLGSDAQQCHQVTGKCNCKPGYFGDKCEFCENEAPIISHKCCNCNEALSEAPICDRRGLCKCKAHVIGDKCEKCHNSYYYKENIGCVTCGKCYEMVSTQLKDYRMKLAAAKKLIAESLVKHNTTIISQDFNTQIIKLENKIEELLTEMLDYKNMSNTQKSRYIDEVEGIENLTEKVKLITTEFDALTKQVVIKKTQNIAKLTQKIENLNKTITFHNQNLKGTHPVNSSELIKIQSEAKELSEKMENVMNELEIIDGTMIKMADINHLINFIKKAMKSNKAALDKLKHKFTRINRDWKKEVTEVRDLSVKLKKTAEYINNKTKSLNLPDIANIDIDKSNFDDIKSKLEVYTFHLNYRIDFKKAQNKINKINEFIKYAEDIREKNRKHIEEYKKMQLNGNVIQDKVTNERKIIHEKIKLLKEEIKGTKADIEENQKQLNEELLPKIKDLKRNITQLISTKNNTTENINTLINSLEKIRTEIDEIIEINKNKQEALQMQRDDLNIFEININSLINREEKIRKLITLYQQNSKVVKEIEKMYMDNVSIMKELISILAINPLYEANHDQLIEAEKEIKALEEYYSYHDNLIEYRKELRHEVEKIKVIVDNLPEKKAFCRASDSISKK